MVMMVHPGESTDIVKSYLKILNFNCNMLQYSACNIFKPVGYI